MPAEDLLKKLSKETNKLPNIRFFSLDIHNSLYPKKIFNEEGFEFVSIDPTQEMVGEIANFLFKKRMINIPVKIVACDTGSIPRTEKLAEKLLISPDLPAGRQVEVVYMQKKRIQAGVVSSAKIAKIEKWKKEGKKIIKSTLGVPKKSSLKETVLIYSDDMIDTGGTAEKDINFLSGIYPNCAIKIFVATHPVLSRGHSAFKRIGADIYFVGNSLNIEGLSEQSNVRLVDMASAIYRAIVK